MQYRVDDLLVDLTHRRVTRSGKALALPDLSWRVFSALIDKAPDPMSFDDLAVIAWRREHVSADTLSQRIKLLRQALGDDPAAPRYIATERGVGYRLATTPEVFASQKINHRAKVMWFTGGTIGVAAAGLLVSTIITAPQSQLPAASTQYASAISVNDLIDRGRVYLARGSYDDNENALGLFRQALNEDPENIPAMIGLSFALSHRATKYDFGSETTLEAQTLAQHAVDASPRDALAWQALGFAKDAQGRVSEALRAYEQAIAIDPARVGAISSAAYLLQVQGRFHEALLLEKQALDNGTPTLFSFLQIASALHLAGLDDDANAWLTRAKTLTPDNLLLKDIEAEYFLTIGDYERVAAIAAPDTNPERRAALDVRYGEAMLALGQTGEASAAFRNAKERDENSADGAFELAALNYRNGIGSSTPPAEHALISGLHEARQEGDQWPGTAVSGAYIFASMGDEGGAIELLREAHTLGYRNYRRLKHSPFLISLHNNQAFSALLAEMESDAATQRSLIINDQRLAALLASEHQPALSKPRKSP